MASPFSVFRRNQRAMLAVAGVAIMIVFVLGDPITKYLGRAGGTENPVIVKANSHSYRASELIALVQSRQMVKNFLQRLALECVQKEVEANHIPSQQAGAYVEATFERWYQELMGRLVPPDELPADDDDSPRQGSLSMDEAQAIQTVVLATAAEQQGMLITDQVVNDYLAMITRNLISSAEFERIVGSLSGESRHMSQALLFDSLRREILASRYSFMYRISLSSHLPAPRWEYFQKLNKRADAEIVGVAVEGFIKDVPEPSEAELKAFFEQYREVLPVPGSPTPGFKRPAKAKFQYFLADIGEFTDRALAKVTPEEIREYYEKNKDMRYRERKLDPARPSAADSDPDSDDVNSDDTPSGDSGSAPAAGAGSEKKPAAGSDPAPAPPTDGGKKSSRSVPASSLHLVALAQKPDAKTPATPPAAAPVDAKPATPAPAAVTKPADAKPADSAPANAAPAAAADEKPAADSTEPKSDTSDAAPSDAAGEKKPVAYEPLEKVEEEIRKAIAGEKANHEVDEIFQRLSSKMREYSSALGEYEVRKEEDSDAEEPEPLDLAALASAEGLTAKETDLVSADELQADTDIGKSYSFALEPRSQMGFREIPFPEIGFTDRKFKPQITDDRNNDRYLSWKVKETPMGVPDFDEVRKEVARALKLVQARKLAVAAAQELTKEARTAGKPLSEVFAGREGIEVVKTDWFSWMTTGNVAFDPGANQPRLSDVHGVQSPGDEFMEAVFTSTPDQISVALNEPKTVAYVIQVKAYEPPQDQLRQEFLLEDFRKYARLAMNVEQGEYVDWLRWLDRQAGVTWVNPGFTSRRVSSD